MNESLEQQVKDRTKELEIERERAIKHSNIKSQFVSTISHEMRTPLNGLLGSLSLMAKHQHIEPVQSLLAMMNTSASALAQLINDVLDLSIIEAGKLELDIHQVNISSVIENTVISLSPQALERDVDIEVDVTGIKHVTIAVDDGRFVQILNNLIGNALKFTPKGSVSVVASTSELLDKVRVNVAINDTGIGIDKEMQPKLFRSFVQADNTIAAQFGGTGLGLAISQQLCHLMAGDISVNSVKGQGSTFSFYVDTPLAQATSRVAPKILAGKSFKLLIEKPYLLTKWQNMIQMFGGAIDEQTNSNLHDVDYLIVDTHYPEYEAIKSNAELLPRTILLTRHSEAYPEMRNAFALLSRPTAMISFGQLFTADTQRLAAYKGSLTKFEDEMLDFPILAGKTFLVVDDNNINVEILCHFLEQVQANSIVADSGITAIERLIEASATNTVIDAILMDCQMPIMDGYQATQRIRAGDAGQQYCATPIIAVTANAMSDEREKCVNVGMDEYLTKPIDSSKLYPLLTRFIEYAPQQAANQQVSQVDNTVVRNEAQQSETLEAPAQEASGRKITDQPNTEQKNTEQQTLSLNSAAAIKRLTGNVALYKKLLIMLEAQAPAMVDDITQALSDEKTEALKLASHTLKGTAGNIGADKLHLLCAGLEKLAAKNEIQAATALMPAINSELAQVIGLISEQQLAV
ncbi:ATP-binding protein [Colwellia sp. MEBiC06753]